ncbi:hypothetical protein SNEBB_001861 [Seison nebaliae]|nr:hypothetical protein SNEBB_001861 [Seison nebaliae]
MSQKDRRRAKTYEEGRASKFDILSPEEEERRITRRLRNKCSAKKHKKKQENQLFNLQNSYEQYLRINKQKMEEINNLERRIAFFEDQLAQCECNRSKTASLTNAKNEINLKIYNNDDNDHNNFDEFFIKLENNQIDQHSNEESNNQLKHKNTNNTITKNEENMIFEESFNINKKSMKTHELSTPNHSPEELEKNNFPSVNFKYFENDLSKNNFEQKNSIDTYSVLVPNNNNNQTNDHQIDNNHNQLSENFYNNNNFNNYSNQLLSEQLQNRENSSLLISPTNSTFIQSPVESRTISDGSQYMDNSSFNLILSDSTEKFNELVCNSLHFNPALFFNDFMIDQSSSQNPFDNSSYLTNSSNYFHF